MILLYDQPLNLRQFDAGIIGEEPLHLGLLACSAPSRSAAALELAGRTGVAVTIDAEIAPHTSDWQRDRGRFALDRDVYGVTRRGERGLRHQLGVLEQHGLKGVVFVEALSADVLGVDLLAEIVEVVQQRGHEVALHIHTEWLAFYKRPLLGDRLGRHIRDFSEDDQRRLFDRALENFARAGVRRTVAFRAGNAGANLATLRAARQSGLKIDSSYFAPQLNRNCGLPPDLELSQPVPLEGVLEVPISWFRDGLGRVRPAQLCACSSAELENLLLQAWRRGWSIVTILLHSFELVRRRSPERAQTVMRLHDHRLTRLCRFVAANKDKFVSTTLRDLQVNPSAADTMPGHLRSSLVRTVQRYAEQAAGRVW